MKAHEELLRLGHDRKELLLTQLRQNPSLPADRQAALRIRIAELDRSCVWLGMHPVEVPPEAASLTVKFVGCPVCQTGGEE